MDRWRHMRTFAGSEVAAAEPAFVVEETIGECSGPGLIGWIVTGCQAFRPSGLSKETIAWSRGGYLTAQNWQTTTRSRPCSLRSVSLRSKSSVWRGPTHVSVLQRSHLRHDDPEYSGDELPTIQRGGLATPLPIILGCCLRPRMCQFPVEPVITGSSRNGLEQTQEHLCSRHVSFIELKPTTKPDGIGSRRLRVIPMRFGRDPEVAPLPRVR